MGLRVIVCGGRDYADQAAILYPRWGNWLSELEQEAIRLHGFGWGKPFPKPRDERQGELFLPMCSDCLRRSATSPSRAQEG